MVGYGVDFFAHLMHYTFSTSKITNTICKLPLPSFFLDPDPFPFFYLISLCSLSIHSELPQEKLSSKIGTIFGSISLSLRQREYRDMKVE